MKYLIIWGGCTDTYSGSYSKAWEAHASAYSMYTNTLAHTGDDVACFPVKFDGADVKFWHNPTFRLIYASSSSYRHLGAYGATSTATYTSFNEYDGTHYLTTGCSGNAYLKVGNGPSYIYGEDEGIDTLTNAIAAYSGSLATYFVSMPTHTIQGTFKPIDKTWRHTFFDANEQYELTSLTGTTTTVASYAAMFIPLDFKYNGEKYKAIAIAPRNMDAGTNQTRIDLFKEYPAPHYDSHYSGEDYIALPSYDDDDTEAYIPDMSDTHIEFMAGDEIEGDCLFEFDEGTEMPESLARFFDANFEEGRTYQYTVDGVQTKATWELATPYEKMAVTAENANAILTFTDSSGQDVSMIFATGKDPAEYAVAGARLYDGDTGDEIGFCKVNESIELPADVYNLQIRIEYENLPEGEDITAYFYQNAAEKNRVDKTDYLTEAFTQRGYLRSACDVTNPVMVFEYQGPSIPVFNYVYIPRFSRYYYLEKLVIIDTGLYEMYLKVDVLNTYKDTIKAQAGTVARNQYDYNEALTDGQRAVENTPHTSRHTMTTEGTPIVQGLGDLDIDTPACYVISVLTSQT